MFRNLVASIVIVAAASSVALARPEVRITQVPPQKNVAQAFPGSVLYINRCVGGCSFTQGPTNASTDTSDLIPSNVTVPDPTPSGTFKDENGVDRWDDIMTCIKQVYSPFNVVVTDVRPPAGSPSYNMTVVAGSPSDFGQPMDAGGFASVTSDCTPISNSVSFVFATMMPVFAQEDGNSIVNGTCWVLAQESAHAYGLDHEYVFSDKKSACNDPMTYRDDCGGQKFFRNKFAQCGEFGPARATCGFTGGCQATQNSHQKLINVFGPGTSITTAPEVTITSPAAGATIGNSDMIHAMAGAQRGIEKIELYLNGFKWTEVDGVKFGPDGQPVADYALEIPADVPDSIIDVVVKAYDDLGVETDASVQITKNKACADAATDCALGQKCEQGKCFWDAPVGEVGDTCEYPQFCKSLDCEGNDTIKICTQSCIPATADACPAGLQCIEQSPTKGVCFLPDEGGGCCSVGAPGSIWVHAGFGVFVLGILLRRRRR